jgi:hypothetical protein
MHTQLLGEIAMGDGPSQTLCGFQHRSHWRKIAGMRAAMQPPNRSARINEGCARQLCTVLKFGSLPVLPKAGGFIFCAPCAQGWIGKQLQEVEFSQTHDAIGKLVRVADAEIAGIVLAAKRQRFFLGTDRDEPDTHAGLREGGSELAQLRERFSKERSSDVAQPDDERRWRDAQREDFGW